MNTRAKAIADQYLLMALLVVAVRALFRFLFGGLSLAAFWLGLKDGLWLSIWVLGFGLLNLTFDFSKLAGRLPGRLGTALSIAINLVPEQARSIERIRYASGLRARRHGSNLLRSVIAPVLRSSVDGSLELAASMETRGFGKSNQQKATVPGGIRFRYRAGATKYYSHEFHPGTVTLISGPTGSGKSTILKLACGLAPHFTGGQVSQRTPQPSELAGSIAYVGQNPSHSFVAATVFDELAFAPNQLNLPQTQIEPIAKRFGLTDKYQMDPRTLSAGWQQRVAIAAALTSGAKTLLLDEPFSMLDSEGREVLVKLLSELKALGYAIAIAEHRTRLLEGLVDAELTLGEPTTRKKKAQIRKSSAELHNFQPVSVAYGQNKVFEGFEVSIPKGSVSTVTGPNGSGKSSLLRALAKQNATLVPQPATDLLFMNSVLEELDQSDRDNRKPRGTAEALLKRLVPEIPLENNPTDISEGQKLALAIAVQLGQERPILLLDEPTVGFDEAAKNRLSDLLMEITKLGKTVLLATHDHEFAKGISTNTINLGGANVR